MRCYSGSAVRFFSILTKAVTIIKVDFRFLSFRQKPFKCNKNLITFHSLSLWHTPSLLCAYVRAYVPACVFVCVAGSERGNIFVMFDSADTHTHTHTLTHTHIYIYIYIYIYIPWLVVTCDMRHVTWKWLNPRAEFLLFPRRNGINFLFMSDFSLLKHQTKPFYLAAIKQHRCIALGKSESNMASSFSTFAVVFVFWGKICSTKW